MPAPRQGEADISDITVKLCLGVCSILSKLRLQLRGLQGTQLTLHVDYDTRAANLFGIYN